jgi:hypothetical protein
MLNFLKAVDIILLCRRKLNEKSQTGLADLEATNDNGRQKPQDIDPIQVSTLWWYHGVCSLLCFCTNLFCIGIDN